MSAQDQVRRRYANRLSPAEQLEHDQREAQWAGQVTRMKNKNKSDHSGIARQRPDRDAADSALDDLHGALVDALPVVQRLIQTESAIEQADGPDAGDAARAPVLADPLRGKGRVAG